MRFSRLDALSGDEQKVRSPGIKHNLCQTI